MLNIRKVKPADLPALAGIYSDVYKCLKVGEKWTPKTALVFLKYWLKKQPDLARLAEENGKIVGAFFTAVKPYWDGNHLFDGELFVAPKFQQKGVGAKLLLAVLNKAVKKYKVVQFEAFTYTNRAQPLKWYKNLGINRSGSYVMISGRPKKIISNLTNS